MSRFATLQTPLGTVCVVVSPKASLVWVRLLKAGCGSICPAFDRGCYGCFGQQGKRIPLLLSDRVLLPILSHRDASHLLQSFHAYSPEFATEAQRNHTIDSSRRAKRSLLETPIHCIKVEAKVNLDDRLSIAL